ncbi:MAG: hypothetical protein KKC76_06235 [Proteobacteria bacterium]|nr:hypothetical protein [Pseudomonadota bacterium]MBU4297619.1 hypothetical protein [Pseudomonadota bacterium]MCG2750018.1 hypothetical protein [Desulfobulbaceae bacterium]
MHSEENTHKQNSGASPSRRVRSLLGLPDKLAGSLQGHGPLPPGAFRYQRHSGFEEPLAPSPFSRLSADQPGFEEPLVTSPYSKLPADQTGGKEETLDGINRGTEIPPAMTVGASSQDARQTTPQTTDNVRNMPQPLTPGESPQAVHEARAMQHNAQGGEKLRTGPVAVNTHRPSDTATALQARARPPVQMMPDRTQIMAEPEKAEALRQTGAGGELNALHGNRQEIAIPGRSTVRQFFAALATAANDTELPAADQPPTPSSQPGTLPAGQTRQESAAMVHGKRPVPRQGGTEPAPPPADRQTPGTSAAFSAAAPNMGATLQTAHTVTTASAQATQPVAEQRSQPRVSAGNSTEHGRLTAIAAAANEIKPALVARQGQQHPPVQAQVEPGAEKFNTSVTPARRPDADGVRQIEELRRTFYELVSKKNTAAEAHGNEQNTAVEAETPPQTPVQQVVVINRTAGARNRGRVPSAFWERSYMARTTLKMIR